MPDNLPGTINNTRRTPASYSSEYSYNSDTIKNTEQFLDMLVNKYGSQSDEQSGGDTIDTEAFQNILQERYNEFDKQTGGNNIDTENFLSILQEKYDNITPQKNGNYQKGGNYQDSNKQLNLNIESEKEQSFTETEVFLNKIFGGKTSQSGGGKYVGKYRGGQYGGGQYGGESEFSELDVSGINLSENFNNFEQTESLFDNVFGKTHQTGGSYQTGGSNEINLSVNNSQNYDFEDTDALFRSLFEKTSHNRGQSGGQNGGQSGNQSGGKRTGKRKLNRVTQGAKSSSKITKSASSEMSESSKSPSYASELGRLIKNQGTVIHERVVKKIMDLLKIDEEVAKNYKSALWRMAKEKNPELVSNLDKSVAMANMIDGEGITEKDAIKLLKTIDIKKTTKERTSHLEKKATQLKEKKSSNKSDKKKITKKSPNSDKATESTAMSATSSAVPSESNFSATSFTDNVNNSISNNSPDFQMSEGSYVDEPLFSQTSELSDFGMNSESIDIDMQFSEYSDSDSESSDADMDFMDSDSD
jgi:hypothetical protein